VLAKTCADRVEGDVPKDVLEMIVALDGSRAEPGVEEVAVEHVALVELSRVSAVELMHADGKRLGRSLDYEVKVICHQAVRDVVPLPKTKRAMKESKEQLAVDVVAVDRLATIAA
jgi:hypothetical protein